MSSDLNSLAHTKWNCKYHIVFAPKYRKQVIYGKLKKDIGQILRQLCERKGVEIIEAEACKDPFFHDNAPSFPFLSNKISLIE
jgi:putative transposase